MSIEQLDKIDYQYPKHGKFRWLTIILVLFVLTTFSYFPIIFKVKSIIKKQVQTIPGCPIDYLDIETEFFLPKFIIKELTIPSRCFGQFGAPPLKLKNVYLHIRGLSFSPFGPHFMLETDIMDNNIKAYITTGINGVSLNIRENTIEAKLLSLFIKELKLLGQFKIDAFMSTGSEGINDFKLNIRSKDLVVPPQKIASLSIYTLKLNDLLIQSYMQDSKIIIKDIVIGDMNSPIRANYKGHIDLVQPRFKRSKIDIKGEVKFSEKFIEDYAILKFALPQFTKKDEFYQINLKGPITRPKPSSK
jgi:hypothetical protein